MNQLSVNIEVTGYEQFDKELQRYRNALADRKPLHTSIATDAAAFTSAYIRGLNRHNSAARLGAKPSGFHERAAKSVSHSSDDVQATVRIPRRTGLGRAFRDIVIRPGSGRKYLTLPGHEETYGKVARDFPEGTFKFSVLKSWRTFLVLVFAEASGRHEKGDVAYWLKREVTQKQDRTLLPSEDGYAKVARGSTLAYIANHIYRSA